ncbi:hypothetical protein ABZX69_44705 [Streptomyces sp. NPDC004074]|uniref:hypothetical protein n=1 Tax=Streptomyces sp. NPDC004074 TaxID=3154277 RepID=UPI0033BB7000
MGDQLTVFVAHVDPERRRLSLSRQHSRAVAGRTVPSDGHAHPDRPDGQEAAAVDGQERGADACEAETRTEVDDVAAVPRWVGVSEGRRPAVQRVC